jgi:hypothetical protein
MLTKLLTLLRSAFVCTCALLPAAAVAQATLHVGPGQTYTTIQSAIDAADNAEKVLVAPGIYNEHIDFEGKAITVTSSDGPTKTIIDGGNKPGVATVTFQNNEIYTSVISGFTIRGGGDNIFTTNIWGGIWAGDSSPTIQGNIVTANFCNDIVAAGGQPVILNNEVSGALVGTIDPGPDQSYCSFKSGILIEGPANPYTGVGTHVIGNTIENNLYGSGINLWAAQAVLIMNNTIRNNVSNDPGSAFTSANSDGTVVVQNLIYGNTSGCGGALGFEEGDSPNANPVILIANNTIVDNVMAKTLFGITNCTNIAQIYPGPYSYGAITPSAVIANNIVSGSTTYPAVNCSWYQTPSESIQPTFENDLLRNAGGPFFGSYCIDVSQKYDNVTSDPQFLDNATHDYHLKSTSPAIDSGTNTVLNIFTAMTGQELARDFDGKPRVQNATGSGCTMDMGAYESSGETADCDGTTETITSSLNPAQVRQSITFEVQLSTKNGPATGTVDFFDGSTFLMSQPVTIIGYSAFVTTTLSVGVHTITAKYRPTGDFGASSASLTQIISGNEATTTTLTCQPTQIAIGSTARFTAKVTSAQGSPTGSVAFADNTVVIATQPLVDGATTLTYTGATAGSHDIIATYEPSGSYALSAAANCFETVTALASASTLTVAPTTSTYGSPVQLKATVTPATPPGSGTPTGTITFLNGATSLGAVPLTDGSAALTTSALPAGTNSLSCAYGGNSTYAASNCAALPVTIRAATTALTLTSSKNPAVYSNSITFTAHLTINGKPATEGNILNLAVNGQTIALTTDAAGAASYTTASLPVGRDAITASFAATDSLLASSASLAEDVTPAATSIQLTSTPNPSNTGQSVTISAVVTSPASIPPNGDITFFSGTTALGTAQLSANGTSSTATFTTSFAAAGTYPLTASYLASTDFLASTSPVLVQTVIAGDFTIAVTPAAATLYTGQSAKVEVGIDSLRGFNEPLAFSCFGLPSNTTCTFAPASLSNGQGAVSLLLQTSAPQTSAAHAQSAANAKNSTIALSALGSFALLLFPSVRRKRRSFTRFLMLLCAISTAISLAGCSNPSPITGGSPPGSYQVQVTAATVGGSSNLTHSTTFNLTVKSLF